MLAEILTTLDGVKISGPLLCKPKVFRDERGFFMESWNAAKWNDLLTNNGQAPIKFVQDNHSSSSLGVLRGLHYQLNPHPQGKLVRCVSGEIFDVAVDLRPNSSTFGRWVGSILNDKSCLQLWIPAGFAHGFLTLSDRAEVLYKASDFWSKECERGIRWNDPDIAIDWPLDKLKGNKPNLSLKDSKALLLSELMEEDLF